MRPINLIPPEERRGDSAPLRTGPMPYVLLAALVALLVGVAAVVLTNNEIGERQSEAAKLEGEDAAAAARAQRLSVYTNFRSMSEARVQTVSELADSRFDWERVMRELSLILPRDVWLVGLTATASADSGVEGGGSGGGSMRAAIAGPALELSGCAKGQEGVAGFVTALKDIDGVTRVGVETSELGEEGKSEGGGGGGGGGSNSSSQCRTRDFIAEFQIVVAFDAAPVAAATEGAEAAPTAESKAVDTKESAEGSSESSEGE